MKALSIIQPWAYAITKLGKDIENRTWRGPKNMIGQRVAIHASKTFEEYGAWWIHHNIGVIVPKDQCPLGAIVASATIVEYVDHSESRWWMGEVGWVFADVVAIEPMPCKGALGLWTIPASIAQIVQQRHRAALAAADLITNALQFSEAQP